MLNRLYPLSLITSLFLSFTVHAQTGDGAFWVNEIREQISKEGHARVLVRFQVDEDLTQERVSSGRSTFQRTRENKSLPEIRATISRGRDELKREMASYGVTIAHEYRNFPVILTTVDMQQYERLLENENVVSIQLDNAIETEKAANRRPTDRPANTGITEDREILRPQLFESTDAINARDVWELGYTGEGQTVVILDNGIDDMHDVFSGKIVHQACFSREFEEGDESLCQDGTEAQTTGAAASYCPDIRNVCAHGTHVAGIAAGKDDSESETDHDGVAPDADIIAIQVFSIFRPSYCPDGCLKVYQSSTMDALEYVIDIADEYNIAAVNLSYGGNSSRYYCDHLPPKPAIDTLRSLGIATVIAAGNGWYGSVGHPACISSAITVSSINKYNNPDLNVFQSPLVDLLAPGVRIASANLGGSFISRSGTSMAAPHVTGAIALLKSAMPSATVDQVEYALKAGGPLESGFFWSFEKPRLDVLAALDFLGEDPPLEGLIVPGVLTSNYEAAQSFIRLRNKSIVSNTVDVTLVDNDSGETVATWSSELETRAMKQIAIREIEAQADVDLDQVGVTYSAYIVSGIELRVQHVVWNSTEGILTNMSPCITGLAENGRTLTYVHTSLIPQYPSLFLIHNNRSVAAKAILTLHDANLTHKKGEVETPEIPPQSSIFYAASDAYDEIGFVPDDGEYHTTFKVAENSQVFAQHIVDNRDAGVLTNMSATCEIPRTIEDPDQ